jgi:hypothetical protein
MQTAFSHRPAGRARPSIPRRRPRGTLGAGVPPRVPPQPAGAACSQAERGGARSGAESMLHAPGEIGARCVPLVEKAGELGIHHPREPSPHEEVVRRQACGLFQQLEGCSDPSASVPQRDVARMSGPQKLKTILIPSTARGGIMHALSELLLVVARVGASPSRAEERVSAL